MTTMLPPVQTQQSQAEQVARDPVQELEHERTAAEYQPAPNDYARPEEPRDTMVRPEDQQAERQPIYNGDYVENQPVDMPPPVEMKQGTVWDAGSAGQTPAEETTTSGPKW